MESFKVEQNPYPRRLFRQWRSPVCCTSFSVPFFNTRSQMSLSVLLWGFRRLPLHTVWRSPSIGSRQIIIILRSGPTQGKWKRYGVCVSCSSLQMLLNNSIFALRSMQTATNSPRFNFALTVNRPEALLCSFCGWLLGVVRSRPTIDRLECIRVRNVMGCDYWLFLRLRPLYRRLKTSSLVIIVHNCTAVAGGTVDTSRGWGYDDDDDDGQLGWLVHPRMGWLTDRAPPLFLCDCVTVQGLGWHRKHWRQQQQELNANAKHAASVRLCVVLSCEIIEYFHYHLYLVQFLLTSRVENDC